MAKERVEYFNGPGNHIRDRIIIHESADMPRNGRFFALNGYSFLAKPNVEIDIPRPVRLMLDTRKETRTTKVDGEERSQDIPRVTYTLIKEGVNIEPAAPPAEVIAGASPPA